MELEIYQIDAFTDKLFEGNPACVVPLKTWLTDDVLIKIAKENGVAETAFFIEKENTIHLRWFTPEAEMDLCGHATLATAYVLRNILSYPKNRIVFETLSGELIVVIHSDLITLNFPSWKPIANAKLPTEIAESLSIQPISVLKSRDYMLVYQTEEEINNLIVDSKKFDRESYTLGNIIATAKGNEVDFVSRFFSPSSFIFEDPVTGSAHCSLIPYWSEQLNKKKLTALQLSERIGKLFCVNNGEKVLISGQARTYFIGKIFIK